MTTVNTAASITPTDMAALSGEQAKEGMEQADAGISEAVLIVESVTPDSSAERAGIESGCRLQIYGEQPLLSPAAFLALQENTLGQASVTLQGEWQGQPCRWYVSAGNIGAETRPDLPPDVLAEYERGREAWQARRFAEAALCWEQAARQTAQDAMAAWLYGKAGAAWESVFEWLPARACYERALQRLQEGQDTAAQTLLWVGLGRCCHYRGEMDAAAQWYAQAQQADERAGRRLWAARSIHLQGSVAHDRRELTQAQDCFARALVQLEVIAPQTLDMAACLNGLGLVAWLSGDFERAQNCHVRARELRERLAPDSLDVAASLNNLGLIAWQRGDLERAQDYHAAALDIRQRLEPDSVHVAMSYNGLGSVAWQRGDVEQARDCYAHALALLENLPPEAPKAVLFAAACHINLGNIAFTRNELEQAQAQYARSLTLFERVAPGSREVASSLVNLGNVAYQRDERDLARDKYAEALTILERVAPASLEYGDTLENLGRVALLQEDYAGAVTRFQQCLAVIEQQRAQIASPEQRALLTAQYGRKYAALFRAYVALDDKAAAFVILERARARSFLELLAERRVDIAAEAHPELLRQQQELDRQRAAAYGQLSRLTATPLNGGQIEALHRVLRQLEQQQQEVTEGIRKSSPRYASLQYPQPLSLQAAKAWLEPGTLLLSMLVEEEQTFVFALTATQESIYAVPLGRDALQQQADAFRRALDATRLDYNAATATAQARQLYDLLLRPAQSLINDAQRLLLCPDGALHTVPFAALVTNARGNPRYLGAQIPLCSILSVTLQAQQNSGSAIASASPVKPKTVPAAWRLLVLGDPLYAPLQAASPEMSQLQTRGLALTPLPHTREEAQFLKQLFGDAAQVKLGSEATKTVVMREGGEVDVLHFACHGWFDPQMPLSSGLVLSQPQGLDMQEAPEDNGLLQAWEIFQHLRLRAQLVALSACDTGLGQEVRGEGLIGLARAFQYAGAQSLVTSLWKIKDASASLFMQAFYAALKTGISKDTAMQQAIQTLLAHPDYKQPFHWSAFVLIGNHD